MPDPSAPAIQLLATSMIPFDTPFPALRGTKFGGVSALVYDRAHDELLGLSDDSENARIFRMKYYEEPFRVIPVGVILLEHAAGAPRRLDPEGLVLLPSGNFLVSSEGIGSTEPRVPPGIIEYRHDGRFVRQLPVPEEFLPPERGALNHGAPNNQAFEALTIASDARRLWTGEETALVQDGPVATADHGSRSRLLEYRLENGAFVPSREFAYDVDALPPVPFPETRFAVSGLVELLALNDRELLSLERAYVEDAADPANSVKRLRIFRVVLDGTPIEPGVNSLAGRTDIVPVTKTLIFDLGASPNLPQALVGLDNFEGLATIPTPPRGRPAAILVSDDNFDARQRTWFVKVGFNPALIP
jgi:3-phytase